MYVGDTDNVDLKDLTILSKQHPLEKFKRNPYLNLSKHLSKKAMKI